MDIYKRKPINDQPFKPVEVNKLLLNWYDVSHQRSLMVPTSGEQNKPFGMFLKPL